MKIFPRRSRMQRTRTGKRLELTDRDVEIFKLLSQYRYLRSTYIHAFVGGASETRFKERLGDLFHEGYLDRPAEQWKFATCRHMPVVHELGAGARHGLIAVGGTVCDQRTWLRGTVHRQFEHSLMVCEVLASIELGMRGRSDLRFIPWPEIRAKAPDAGAIGPLSLPVGVSTGTEERLVPDGLFGIEYTDGGRKLYRFFALEADRATMPLYRAGVRGTSVAGKVGKYRQAIDQQRHKQILGLPNLLVLLVTVGEQRAGNILEALHAGSATEGTILVRAASALGRPDTGLLTGPWARPGHPPLCIGDVG